MLQILVFVICKGIFSATKQHTEVDHTRLLMTLAYILFTYNFDNFRLFSENKPKYVHLLNRLKFDERSDMVVLQYCAVQYEVPRTIKHTTAEFGTRP